MRLLVMTRKTQYIMYKCVQYYCLYDALVSGDIVDPTIYLRCCFCVSQGAPYVGQTLQRITSPRTLTPTVASSQAAPTLPLILSGYSS